MITCPRCQIFEVESYGICLSCEEERTLKTIREYLPKKNKESVQIAGRVPKDTFTKVKVIMEKENLSWNEVLTACLMKFLDESKAEKKSA